jgi:hypothetical protein
MKIMGEKPRRRRSFTPEFKAEIVELWQCGSGRSGVGSGSPASDGPLLCLQQTQDPPSRCYDQAAAAWLRDISERRPGRPASSRGHPGVRPARVS